MTAQEPELPMTQLLAFHGDRKVKAKYLARVRAHAKADRLIRGVGWECGKGCAIGCTLEAYDHARYPIELGIPETLARLEDRIFEGLPNGDANAWPAAFLSAIRPGADLSCVGWQFLHWLLTDDTVNPGINHPLVKDAIRQGADVLAPLTKGEKADPSAAWSAARSAESAARSAASAASAESAAKSAESAAASAAKSAESAAKSAESAAWSAAWSAASAAESAESAARSAWSAAASAESAARSAWSAAKSAESAAKSAESAAYKLMAAKLLQFLRAAPCR